MKIGLRGTPSTDEGWEQVWALIDRLEKKSPSIYAGSALSDAFFQYRREALPPPSVPTLYTIEDDHLPLIADLLVVWGGREALLENLGPIARHGPTVLLVGEMQRFPAIREERLADALGQILSGEVTLDARMLLGVSHSDSKQQRPDARPDTSSGADDVGAEEVVFQRSNDALLRIDLSVNGRPLTTYEADGLVISTPTGSAGRSLSAGGPLVVPSTEGLLLTPVASHTLTDRPLLVPASSRIEARVQSRNGKAFFRVDRSTCPLESGNVITIRRHRSDLQVARPNGTRVECSRKNHDPRSDSSTPPSNEASAEDALRLPPASAADRLRTNGFVTQGQPFRTSHCSEGDAANSGPSKDRF
jgi:NAD+ kinase